MSFDPQAATLFLEAELLASFLETLAFGAFLVLCVKSFCVLLANDRHRSRVINNVMLGITFVELCFIVGHWALGVIRCFESFVYKANQPLETLLYFLTLADPKYLAQTSLYVAQGVVPNLFMTYRLYVIWDCSFWIIIAPLCSVTVTIVFGIGTVVKLSTLPVGADSLTRSVDVWAAPALGATLFTNIWCTTLIAYRIWKSDRYLRQIGVERTESYESSRAVRIMIDSAALYTIVTAIAFITDLAEATTVFLCTVAPASPIIGISYCLIVVRINGNVHQSTNSSIGGGLVGCRADHGCKSSQSTGDQVSHRFGDVIIEMDVNRIFENNPYMHAEGEITCSYLRMD